MPPRFRILPLLALCAIFLLLPSYRAASPVNPPLLIPPGTILPISIKHTFSSDESGKDRAIEARIMQDVPLPDGDKVPAGATLSGTIVSSAHSVGDKGGKLTFRFDKLEFHHENIPVLTSFRAMASMRAVQGAQYPSSPIDAGASSNWATTIQVGGDIRYGSGGEVTNSKKQNVGKGVPNGVLVYISSPPGSPCSDDKYDASRLQAMWVFSANACGVYDLKGIEIISMGRTPPLGEITFAKDKGELKISNSTGMLLRTLR